MPLAKHMLAARHIFKPRLAADIPPRLGAIKMRPPAVHCHARQDMRVGLMRKAVEEELVDARHPCAVSPFLPERGRELPIVSPSRGKGLSRRDWFAINARGRNCTVQIAQVITANPKLTSGNRGD